MHENATAKDGCSCNLLILHRMLLLVGYRRTMMSVGNHLKRRNHALKIHPLEPLELPTRSAGSKIGSHRIQGISDEFIPAILELESLDQIVLFLMEIICKGH
ncbi:MAG: hypothetical protein ACTHK0_06065 [Ginsengibacter sp.]